MLTEFLGPLADLTKEIPYEELNAISVCLLYGFENTLCLLIKLFI